jgi:hypothetical protein
MKTRRIRNTKRAENLNIICLKCKNYGHDRPIHRQRGQRARLRALRAEPQPARALPGHRARGRQPLRRPRRLRRGPRPADRRTVGCAERASFATDRRRAQASERERDCRRMAACLPVLSREFRQTNSSKTSISNIGDFRQNFHDFDVFRASSRPVRLYRLRP